MIEVEHLNKIYGTTTAIKDVTFSVEKGEIVGFLGPNGAGKTTTMRILTGYLPATSGMARIAGFEVHENSMAVRKRIGYLPETPPLYPDMTVEGFLHFVARIKGVPAGDRSHRVDSALGRCNLLEKRTVLIRKLSKGFRQRVGIAQAIVHDPPAIILDEPTVGLDPRQIIDVRNLIKSLAGEHTIILSTHILPEVSMTCNRVTIINRGQIVATNTPEQLMAQLATSSGYELEVEGNGEGNMATVASRLQRLTGVKSVEVVTADYLPANRYKMQVAIEPGMEPGGVIATEIIASGLNLYEMRRVRASLEDVFLELTTEEKMVASASETELSEADLSEADLSAAEPEQQLSIDPSEDPSKPSGGEAA